MSSQLFQKNIDNKILFNFLEKFFSFKKNYYKFSKSSFKSAQFKNLITPFCEELTEYYYPSKISYLNRKMNYKSFVTIIRQICKYKSIPFTSKIIYDKSSYEIIYTIYIPSML